MVDVPQAPRSHLEHQEPGGFPDAEHGQRKSELIVVAAFGGDGLPAPGEHMPHQVLGAGLPRASGDSEHHQVRVLAARPLQLLVSEHRQCLFHVIHEHRRMVDGRRDQGQRGTVSRCGADEVVPVGPFADECREQVSTAHRTRVQSSAPGDRLSACGAADEPPPGHGCDVSRGHGEHAQ